MARKLVFLIRPDKYKEEMTQKRRIYYKQLVYACRRHENICSTNNEPKWALFLEQLDK